MESEAVKASNEHIRETKVEDEAPFAEEAKNQQLPSPSNFPTEVHIDDDVDEKSPLRNNPFTDSCFPATEMKSPTIQTMGQPPGYDPNRIPASVFSSKHGNAADNWSATSDESLFSIHMGNHSFSRDYAILFGKSGEMKYDDGSGGGSQVNPFMISGEFPRLDEWNNSPQLPQPSHGKSNDFGNIPPPVKEESSLNEHPKVENKVEVTSPNHLSSEVISVSVAKKPPLPETNSSSLCNSTLLTSASCHSDASGHSSSSFAFPVLGSNDSGKHDSVKVVHVTSEEKTEKGDQQPHSLNQAQVSKETSSSTVSAGTRWFSCFSCWPRFC